MKMKRTLSYIRLALYAALLIYVFFLPGIHGAGGCVIRRLFGFLCPTCGATRACIAFLHFDFVSALKYHPVFTLSLYPVAVITALQDIYVIIKRELFGGGGTSLLEAVFI